jgi:membrane-associated PAP2 superfamily phosphatase
MNSSSGPITAYRSYWFPELVTLAAVALIATVLFAFTNLDIVSIRSFYHPELSDSWPVASGSVWSLFYRSAPWVTGSLALAGTALLVVGVVHKRSQRFRLYGLFILLCVIIGPGLITNVVLKDHWGRPRPRQIVEFGGRLEYVQPLLPSPAHGKSFPCGHCSVGYLYAVGWWVWRRRHPRWAFLSLVTGLALGTLLGLGRMAGGAHFLSDAVWSALIAYIVAHVLYYYLLRVPAREDSRVAIYPLIEQSPRLKAATIATVMLLSAGIIIGGVLANPLDKDLTAHIRLADFPTTPETVELLIDTLDVYLTLVTEPSGEIDCTGNIHAFGLPTNEINVAWEFDERAVPTLRYRITMHGIFTEIDGIARIRLPVQNVRKIIVNVKHGDIRVADMTGSGLPAGNFPVLDLRTADGHVQKP